MSKKWGLGLVGLGLFGVLATAGCGKPAPGAWFDSWCAKRAECSALPCQQTGSQLQARYDANPICKDAVDTFRQCTETPDPCGTGLGCGSGFLKSVIDPCFCGDGVCATDEDCDLDCASS